MLVCVSVCVSLVNACEAKKERENSFVRVIPAMRVAFMLSSDHDDEKTRRRSRGKVIRRT